MDIKYWRCPTCGCVGRKSHEYHGGCDGYARVFHPQMEMFPRIAFPPVVVYTDKKSGK